jgi:hypothetical protein
VSPGGIVQNQKTGDDMTESKDTIRDIALDVMRRYPDSHNGIIGK